MFRLRLDHANETMKILSQKRFDEKRKTFFRLCVSKGEHETALGRPLARTWRARPVRTCGSSRPRATSSQHGFL